MKKKTAITKEKVLIALFVMIYAVVALSLISKVGAEHIEHAKRQKELSNMQAYEVYSSYVMTRESYYVYMMCNPEYSISDVIHNFFDSEYFNVLKSKIDDLKKSNIETPNIQAQIFMMLPDKDEGIYYGWEKDELNIKQNFDTSVFHRMTQCTITVPYGAMSLEDCTIEYQNAD